MLWSGDIGCFWPYGDGDIRNPALGLRRILLLGTSVNKQVLARRALEACTMGQSSSTFGGDAGMNDFAGRILRFARTLGSAWRRSKDFRVLVYLVVLLLLSGTIFYSIVEGWSPLDAFYFSATTLTTVGFGDLAPQTALGKLCTVLYLFVGLGIIGGFINTVAKESWRTGDMRQSSRESQEDAPGS